MQQGNGPDQNPSPQHQPQHPHQQQWVPHMQQQQQWMAAMQYPAAAMAMMQQQMMMYPHQQHHHYMAYYQQQQHQHQQYQNKQQQYHQKQQKQLQQQGSNEEAKTIWVGDLLHWMDEAYLHNCFSHTGEKWRESASNCLNPNMKMLVADLCCTNYCSVVFTRNLKEELKFPWLL